MSVSRLIAAALCGALAAGCSDEGPESGAIVTAMTRNVYVGADIEQILTATSPQDLVAKVEQTYQELLATKIEERAKALAAEIAAADPDVVGLQEISLIRLQSPGDAGGGGTTPATTVQFDYLQLILDELTALGKPYVTAAKVENFDVEMPRPNGDDVRLTDFDVIIVRSGVTYAAASTGNFATILSVPIATGQFVDIKRGWAAIDLTVDGVTFRVANTHLESASTPIRLAQGLELLDELAGETRPTIVLGDLNSPVDGSDPTYPEYIDAGFVDAWPLASTAAGLTCCQNYDLKNSTSVLDKRIDLVLFRHSKDPFSVTADVVGDDPSERTASGLWPADHAGVWARINFRR